MKRFAYLAVSAFVVASVLSVRPASATPFNDVPANSWAADYIQTLAADGILAGYPNGKFLGNRPMTRNEVAVALARAIAKVEAEGGASKADLQKLARLMDAYKDELDGMGVRVTQIEDKLAALDKATKFAQGFTVHGTLWSSYSQREQIQNPNVLPGAPSCPTGGVCLARSDPVFNFTDQFIENDQSNDPYYGRVGPGLLLPRAQWEFTPSYAVNQNLIISLPIKIADYMTGGYRQQQTGVGINPTLEVNVPNMNGVTGLNIRIGQLENIKGSLTGLTYSPADNFHINYTDPFRPYPNGVDVTATIMKYLDVQAYGTKIDPVGILTNAPGYPPNTGYIQSNTYLGPYYFQQTSNVYSSAPTTDTFTSGNGTLSSVTLSQNAQPGTVFVSYYMGPPACLAGCFFTGPNQPNEPSFSFVQTPNAVVFSGAFQPLPAGVTVAVTYQGYSVSNSTFPQRFDVGGRAVYRIPGIPSAQVGFSINRLFDLRGDSAAAGNTIYLQSASIPNTIVSDTVFGFDFVLPLTRRWGPIITPALYGEVATSKYTPDFQRVPTQSDTAGVVGVKFKLWGGDQTLSYQSVGPYYIDGAQFMWAGQAPGLFSFWNFPQLPTGFGIGNTFGINQQVDNIALANGYGGALLQNSGQFPFGTFDFPLFNQFKAQGPYFYSSFAPNTRGPSAQFNFPVRIGGVNLKLRLGGQQLQEIRPNSLAAAIFGPQFSTGVGGKYQTVGGGFTLGLPIWDRTATLNFDALYERIQRLDTTPFVYAADPLLGIPNAYNPLGSAELTGTGQVVYFYPNYQNVRHLAGSGSLALPITAALTANVSYVNQAWGGEALNTLNQSISQTKTALNAGVLYNIPNTNSSINFFFTNYHWQDNQLPSYNWNQNRQNIYFTVKF